MVPTQNLVDLGVSHRTSSKGTIRYAEDKKILTPFGGLAHHIYDCGGQFRFSTVAAPTMKMHVQVSRRQRGLLFEDSEHTFAELIRQSQIVLVVRFILQHSFKVLKAIAFQNSSSDLVGGESTCPSIVFYFQAFGFIIGVCFEWFSCGFLFFSEFLFSVAAFGFRGNEFRLACAFFIERGPEKIPIQKIPIMLSFDDSDVVFKETVTFRVSNMTIRVL